MTRPEFKNFYKLLQEDIDYAEHLGYAFLNCTEKQIGSVIRFYQSKGLCEEVDSDRGRIFRFGKSLTFEYPVKEVAR